MDRKLITVAGAAASLGFAVLAALALIAPDWIENLVGFDPDASSGTWESMIALAAAACAIGAALIVVKIRHIGRGRIGEKVFHG